MIVNLPGNAEFDEIDFISAAGAAHLAQARRCLPHTRGLMADSKITLVGGSGPSLPSR
jgi:hypothetical protein